MSLTKDAPVFAQPGQSQGDTDPAMQGISARDWIAVQAMMSLLSGREDIGYPKDDERKVLASYSYEIADAMIEQSAK